MQSIAKIAQQVCIRPRLLRHVPIARRDITHLKPEVQRVLHVRQDVTNRPSALKTAWIASPVNLLALLPSCDVIYALLVTVNLRAEVRRANNVLLIISNL